MKRTILSVLCIALTAASLPVSAGRDQSQLILQERANKQVIAERAAAAATREQMEAKCRELLHEEGFAKRVCRFFTSDVLEHAQQRTFELLAVRVRHPVQFEPREELRHRARWLSAISPEPPSPNPAVMSGA